jgi:hypothetical protein
MMKSDSDDKLLAMGEQVHEQCVKEEAEDCDDSDDSEALSELNTTSRKDWRRLWRSQQQYWRERGDEDNGPEEYVVFDSNEEESPSRVAGFHEEGRDDDFSDEGSHGFNNEELTEEQRVLSRDAKKAARNGWRLMERLQTRLDVEKGKSQSDEPYKTAEVSDVMRDIFTIGSLNSLNEDEDAEKRLFNEKESEQDPATSETESNQNREWDMLKKLRQGLDVEKEKLHDQEKQPGGSSDALESGQEIEEDVEPEDNPEKDHTEANFGSRWAILKRFRPKPDTEKDNSCDQAASGDSYEPDDHEGSTTRKDCASVESPVQLDDTVTKDVDEKKSDSNVSPRKAWGLLKRVQQKFAERSEDKSVANTGLDEPFFITSVTTLHTRNQELEELVRHLQESNSILKDECKLNSAKVHELTEAFEAKQNNVVEEKLLNKSIQNAELSMKLDDVKMELEKANRSILQLGEEREENKRLIDGMSKVFVALHSAQVDEASTMNRPESNEKLTLDELEKKIKDIMEDRERLVNSYRDLERENQSKDEHIEDLVEALDSQSFRYDSEGSDEKHKEDDQSVRSEMTKSTCATASTSLSSVSFESEDYSNSKFRSLYRSVSSKMMGGVAKDEHSILSGMESLKTEMTQSTNGASLSSSSIPEHSDDLESIKERLNIHDPKYVEFLTLMKGSEMAVEPFRSINEEAASFEESPKEHPDEENLNQDEFIVDLVL